MIKKTLLHTEKVGIYYQNTSLVSKYSSLLTCLNAFLDFWNAHNKTKLQRYHIYATTRGSSSENPRIIGDSSSSSISSPVENVAAPDLVS